MADTPRCHLTCSARTPAQSEDDPIGWFELENDWNDVEIKLQQCRIAKVRLNFKRRHHLKYSAPVSALSRLPYILTPAATAPHPLFLLPCLPSVPDGEVPLHQARLDRRASGRAVAQLPRLPVPRGREAGGPGQPQHGGRQLRLRRGVWPLPPQQDAVLHPAADTRHGNSPRH